jgi:hypothetical protein
MRKLDKYKNNPLALQAWREGYDEGYEEGLDQCQISVRVVGWGTALAIVLMLIGFVF